MVIGGGCDIVLVVVMIGRAIARVAALIRISNLIVCFVVVFAVFVVIVVVFVV